MFLMLLRTFSRVDVTWERCTLRKFMISETTYITPALCGKPLFGEVLPFRTVKGDEGSLVLQAFSVDLLLIIKRCRVGIGFDIMFGHDCKVQS